jgi:hypothetical protein
MQNIYRQIYLDIATYLPVKNVRYLEELSGIADVGVVSVVDGNRKPTGDHLKTIKMRDGSTRIDGAIALQLRKNANGLYMLDEKHVFIDVAMNDIGNIQNHTPTAISYVDPFENEKHGVFENSVSIAATDYVLGKLDVTPKKLTIKTNQTGAVSTVFVPSRMRDRRVAWSIEDTTVLKIISSNDAKLVVKGLKRGETRIIARHIESGKEVSADIVVIPFKVDPKKLFGEEPERSGTVDKFIVQ